MCCQQPINVTFQIIDNTLVATEGAVLDKQALTYTVKRTLTGDRINPQETVTVTAPQSLTATFTPDFFSKDEVVWTSSDPAVVQVAQDNDAYREASVSAFKDAAWIRNIIATDNGIKSNDPYAKVSGSGSRDVVITVDGKDKLGNKASAVCQVSINFVTDDQTRVVRKELSWIKQNYPMILAIRWREISILRLQIRKDLLQRNCLQRFSRILMIQQNINPMTGL